MAHPMLLLAWLAVGLALAQGQTYPAFVQKHVDYPRTPVAPYCDVMMQRRGMTTPVCKHFNVFIHASEDTVTDVCGRGGTPVPGRNWQDSVRAFELSLCLLRGPTQTPPCRYQASNATRHVRLACENRRPVHFVGML